MANKYTEHQNKETQKSSNKELLLKIMQEEFPDDTVYKNGTLSQRDATLVATADNISTKKVKGTRGTAIAERNEDGTLNITQKLEHLMLDSTAMEGHEHAGAILGTEREIKEFTKYPLDKTIPTVDEDELDELIDEEWEYFEDPEDEPPIIIIEKGQSGLFLANRSFQLRDIHDLYIQEGPERVLQLGEDETQQITDIFCIFYTDDGIAYPIPNYKTLEVMLVEEGINYKSVRPATTEQFKQFDLIMDGDQTPGDEITPIDEFTSRLGSGIVRDRSNEWSPDIRFRSMYEPTAPFKRDPGDYIKPEAIRGQNMSESSFGPRIDLYQQEDLEDMYFDQVFMSQTTREKLREKYEGRMIILDWPTSNEPGEEGYDHDDVSRGTSVGYDDAVWGLRMMINGHWKQVRDQFVMRLYAETNLQFLDNNGKMALTQYQEGQGRYGVRGVINLLVKAGAVTVINQAGDTAIQSDDGTGDPLWSLFSHIVEADGADVFEDPVEAAAAGVRPDGRAGLDKREYIEYLDNYSNSAQPFNIPNLAPYEPPGSVAYYDHDQYKSLIREAIYQGQIDTIKDDILELFPAVAAQVQETRALFNTLPNNYNEYVTNKLGGSSPLYAIMRSSNPWKYIKKKRKKIKTKDDRYNIFKLYMKNGRMRRNLSESEENRIVSNGGKHWMKTIAKDKFPDIIVKAAGVRAGIIFAINPLAGLGALTTYGLSAMVNRLAGSVPHGRVDRLPPWRMMDDDDYLRACIAAKWMEPVEDLYNRSVIIDNNWTEITSYVDEAEGIIEEFDDNLLHATNLEDFQELLDSLTDIMNTINNQEMLDLIDAANQIRKDTDDYLRTGLLNQYKAIEYMRERVFNGQGWRKKFGIAWPVSVQKIMNKHVYGQTLRFDKYNPKK